MFKLIIICVFVLLLCKSFPVFGIYIVSVLGWLTDFVSSIVPTTA